MSDTKISEAAVEFFSANPSLATMYMRQHLEMRNEIAPVAYREFHQERGDEPAETRVWELVPGQDVPEGAEPLYLHPQPAELAEQQGVELPPLPKSRFVTDRYSGTSFVSYTTEQMRDYARAAIAATGKQQVGQAVQDNRFPGGFADAITYVNDLEELAEALHEKVFGHGSDGESGASTVLQMTLHQLNEKPEQVGEVQGSND